jgi:hypothetical protein
MGTEAPGTLLPIWSLFSCSSAWKVIYGRLRHIIYCKLHICKLQGMGWVRWWGGGICHCIKGSLHAPYLKDVSPLCKRVWVTRFSLHMVCTLYKWKSSLCECFVARFIITELILSMWSGTNWHVRRLLLHVTHFLYILHLNVLSPVCIWTWPVWVNNGQQDLHFLQCILITFHTSKVYCLTALLNYKITMLSTAHLKCLYPVWKSLRLHRLPAFWKHLLHAFSFSCHTRQMNCSLMFSFSPIWFINEVILSELT